MLRITAPPKLIMFLTAFFVCAICLCAEAGTSKRSKEKNELIGPVRSVITKQNFLTTTDSYDSSGNLVEIVTEWSIDNKTTRHKAIFTYDEQGRQKEDTSYREDGSIASRKFYRYGFDASGNQTSKIAIMGDDSYAHAEYSIYDDRGNLAEEIFFTGGSFIDKSVFDVQGKVLYAIKYNHNGFVFESTKHYDSKGQLAESLYYGPNNLLTRKDLYRYDEGRRIEEISDLYNHFWLRKIVSKYEFDTAGNWILKIVQKWKNGDDLTKPAPAKNVEERIITYYGK